MTDFTREEGVYKEAKKNQNRACLVSPSDYHPYFIPSSPTIFQHRCPFFFYWTKHKYSFCSIFRYFLKIFITIKFVAFFHDRGSVMTSIMLWKIPYFTLFRTWSLKTSEIRRKTFKIPQRINIFHLEKCDSKVGIWPSGWDVTWDVHIPYLSVRVGVAGF